MDAMYWLPSLSSYLSVLLFCALPLFDYQAHSSHGCSSSPVFHDMRSSRAGVSGNSWRAIKERGLFRLRAACGLDPVDRSLAPSGGPAVVRLLEQGPVALCFLVAS